MTSVDAAAFAAFMSAVLAAPKSLRLKVVAGVVPSLLVNVTVLASESFVTVRCVFLISTDAVSPSLPVMVSVDTSLDFDVKVADFRALWVALMVKVLDEPSVLVAVSTFTFEPADILMASLAWVLMASLDTLKVMAPF